MDNSNVVDSLRRRGLAVLDPMPAAKFAEFRAHLLAQPVYLDAHVPQSARRLGRARVDRVSGGASECVCVENHDVIRAPHFFEVGLGLTDIAGAYLDKDPPVGFSMNAFWTRPGPAGTRPDIQEFHVDADDVRFLALFIYLNDVLTPDDGPQDLHGPDGSTRTILAPAGSMFLADTSRQHRGRKPQKAERGLAWFRWGVSPIPVAYQWDQIVPLAAAELGDRYPSDPRLRESVKLIVQ